MVDVTFDELLKKGLMQANAIGHQMVLDISGPQTICYRCAVCRLEFHVGYPAVSPDAPEPKPAMVIFGPALATSCRAITVPATADLGG